MPIPIELRDLRERLQDVGMVVVEEPDHVTVRLPYFCSVRIHSVDGRLRFESFFGLVPRTRATMLKIFMFTGFTLAAFTRGMPYALAIAMVGIMAGVYDIIRVIVTEGVVTRASVVYSDLLRERSAAPPSLTGQSMHALGAATPQPTIHDTRDLRVRHER